MSREEILEQVADVIVEQLGAEREKVTENATFIEYLAADSLDVVELLMTLEDEFGVAISDEEAVKIKTVGDILNIVNGEAEEK